MKDRFSTRESVEAVIPEIFAHIERTGETHTCPHHTHTKPPKGAKVIFIREFKLPEKYTEVKRFVPCPCCLDEFGKFSHGMIAWFPDEKVIRITGPTCFRKLNPEGYEWAMREFDAEKKRREDTRHLLSKLPEVPDLIRQVTNAITIASAIEKFHQELHRKLALYRVNFWPHVKDGGKLSVSKKQLAMQGTRSGDAKFRETEVSEVRWRLPGYKMLNERRKLLVKALEAARDALKAVEFSNPAQQVEKMNDDEKHSCAKLLGQAVAKANAKIEEVEDLRKFVEPVAINSLRHWTAAEGAPISFFFKHQGQKISFGQYESTMVTVSIPDELYDRATMLSVA